MMQANSVGTRMAALIARQFEIDGEKAQLALEAKELREDVRSAGFDLKAFGQMVRELRMTREDRVNHEAKCQIYRAALGMLDGTPLGDAARHMLNQNTSSWAATGGDEEPGSPEAGPEPEAPAGSDDEPGLPFDPPAPPPSAEHGGSTEAEPLDSPHAARRAAPAAPAAPSQADRLAAAREAGGETGRAGGRISDNPYPADDPCRAAFDEAYCFAAGSDGMDMPAAFRRRGDAAPKAGAAAAPVPEPEMVG